MEYFLYIVVAGAILVVVWINLRAFSIRKKAKQTHLANEDGLLSTLRLAPEDGELISEELASMVLKEFADIIHVDVDLIDLNSDLASLERFFPYSDVLYDGVDDFSRKYSIDLSSKNAKIRDIIRKAVLSLVRE